MIVRARTDINEAIISELLAGKDLHTQVPSSCFFFNSGSASLRFFLQLIGSGARVGVQVYTCSTVLDAIRDEGCTPVFLDINPDYYTSTLDIVKRSINKIDILILTHLFGIPNPDYCEIKQLCKERNVVLIDDLCQTFHAKIGGKFLEEISDNYIYSFFYDKPISTVAGGMLKVQENYRDSAENKYAQLAQDNDIDGRKNLKVLLLMHRLLSPDLYEQEFRSGTAWRAILGIWPVRWNVKKLQRLVTWKGLRIINKVFKAEGGAKIRKMSSVEREYVLSMMKGFHNNNAILENFYKQNSVDLPAYMTNPNIGISAAKRAIVGWRVVADNVQIGLYNWPDLICDKAEYNQYPNAVEVIRTHTNIPCWITF